MATHVGFSNTSLVSLFSAKRLSFLSPPTANGSGSACPPRVIYPGQAPPPLVPSPDFDDQDLALTKHKENLAKVQKMLTQERGRRDRMVMVDCLKHLCIDHHFEEEIESVVKTCMDSIYSDDDLFDATLSFKIMREAGYEISSDGILHRFTDSRTGGFKAALSKDIRGLLSLHDISHLNTGAEKLLYQAKEFSSTHLASSIQCLDLNFATYVRQCMEHPYHVSSRQYRARHHLTYLQSLARRNVAVEELALAEFHLNKSLHQKELQQVTRWWRSLGLAKELPIARDQLLKWYMWSLTALPRPCFSRHRMELTKIISFVYVVDDIFDLIGTQEELSMFTEAIKKWDIAASSSLPNYMRSCYVGIYTTTNDIARMAEKQHGSNPIHYYKNAWAMLFDAFMVEARWLGAKQVPATEDYLRNGAITSGVPLVLLHMLFLLTNSSALAADLPLPLLQEHDIISSSAKILRLWDDLGSAQDEAQQGLDGSYRECYLKENPDCSCDSVKHHVMSLISREWEVLNRERFSRSTSSSTSFSADFIEASFNCVRMVSVMYGYDQERNLPLLEDYVQMLLF